MPTVDNVLPNNVINENGLVDLSGNLYRLPNSKAISLQDWVSTVTNRFSLFIYFIFIIYDVIGTEMKLKNICSFSRFSNMCLSANSSIDLHVI